MLIRKAGTQAGSPPQAPPEARLRKTDNPFIPFIPEARLFRLWGKGGVYGINENKRIRLFAVNGVYRGGQGPFIPFMVRAAGLEPKEFV